MSWALDSKLGKRGKLSDLIFFQRGFDITKAQQTHGPYPVVSSSGITSYHKDYMVNGPGVIIGRKGTLGTVYFCTNNYWPHDTTLWSKDFRGNDPKFVYYFLHTIDMKNYNVGGANPTLNRNHIHEIEVFIPKLSKQHKIASILSAYDDLIETNFRRIALLEEAARLLYQEWFVRLRFPGYEHTRIADGVPEGWEVATAFDAIDVLSGGTPKTDNPSYWNGDIPFFTPKDAASAFYVTQTEKSITEDGLRKCNSKLYPKDTLFITARGTVGKLNLAQLPMAMNQSCYALRGKGNISQYYLYCALKASIEQFHKRAAGAVFDAIVVDTFKMIPFTIPNSGLIDKFNDAVLPMFKQTEVLILQNQKLKQARDLLLPKLMSGEVTV
ncbi:restriction endonuclease subunit S [Sporomusa malonica]|uniref:Type I restriction enzyme, S subunit n=1 Tax=Sporomusa malonica TaxID=112901 RepID=A0A1W2EXU8_9FIRM|nr:restriction endonuclease subunit S [Sporomusa malonica]SMD14519.1 type I restriction enzyme, S subunit [Sporomusa malonica]